MNTKFVISKLRELLVYVAILAIAILLAFNYQLFIVENDFAPAGLNGVATMIQYKTGFSIGYMSLLINVPLCLLAYFLIDKKFAKRSLVFCLTYSLVFLYLQRIGLTQFQYNAQGHDTIFPVLLSGVISGFVYGICFRTNSSTGGTDIVSKYIAQENAILNWFITPPAPDQKTVKQRFLEYFDETKVDNFIKEVQQALHNKEVTIKTKTAFIKAVK